MADQYEYKSALVLAMLPQAFDYHATPTRDSDEDTGGRGDPATGGNTLAHLADIRQQLSRLTGEQRKALYWYAHGEPATFTAGMALGVLLNRLNGKA